MNKICVLGLGEFNKALKHNFKTKSNFHYATGATFQLLHFFPGTCMNKTMYNIREVVKTTGTVKNINELANFIQ